MHIIHTLNNYYLTIFIALIIIFLVALIILKIKNRTSAKGIHIKPKFLLILVPFLISLLVIVLGLISRRDVGFFDLNYVKQYLIDSITLADTGTTRVFIVVILLFILSIPIIPTLFDQGNKKFNIKHIILNKMLINIFIFASTFTIILLISNRFIHNTSKSYNNTTTIFDSTSITQTLPIKINTPYKVNTINLYNDFYTLYNANIPLLANNILIYHDKFSVIKNTNVDNYIPHGNRLIILGNIKKLTKSIVENESLLKDVSEPVIKDFKSNQNILIFIHQKNQLDPIFTISTQCSQSEENQDIEQQNIYLVQKEQYTLLKNISKHNNDLIAKVYYNNTRNEYYFYGLTNDNLLDECKIYNIFFLEPSNEYYIIESELFEHNNTRIKILTPLNKKRNNIRFIYYPIYKYIIENESDLSISVYTEIDIDINYLNENINTNNYDLYKCITKYNDIHIINNHNLNEYKNYKKISNIYVDIIEKNINLLIDKNIINKEFIMWSGFDPVIIKYRLN